MDFCLLASGVEGRNLKGLDGGVRTFTFQTFEKVRRVENYRQEDVASIQEGRIDGS